jgi:hypothetical protein
MALVESLPNLAHVVPDSKKQLRGDELKEFFCCEETQVGNYCSPYYSLHPSNLPSKVNKNSVCGLSTPRCISLRAEGIDAMYIDDVLSPGKTGLVDNFSVADISFNCVAVF